MSDMAPQTPMEFDVKAFVIHDERRLCEALDQRLGEMYEQRRMRTYLWQETFANVLPEREIATDWYQNGYGTGSHDRGRDYAQRIGQHIHDSTAANALQLFSSGLQSFVVSEQDRWFEFVFPHPRMIELPGARGWIQEVERIQYESLARSNFYSELSPLVLDAGSAGTASQRFTYDEGAQQSIFQTMHPLECYIAENKFRQVDTVFRVFTLTKRQAIQQFGAENLSRRIMGTRSYTDTFQFLHAVFPRSDVDPSMGLRPREMGSVMSVDAPWMSIYKEVNSMSFNNISTLFDQDAPSYIGEQQRVISVGGYREFPYAVWRWDTLPETPYGVSPTQRMLPQIRTLQFVGEMVKTSAQLHARPPYNVPAAMQGRARVYPGAFNYYSDHRMKLEAVTQAGGDFPISRDSQEDLRKQVNQSYGVDWFVLVSRVAEGSATRTATEIQEMQAEKAAVLSAVRRRMSPDYLVPTLAWQFAQEKKRDRFPPAPPAVLEFAKRFGSGDLKVNFVGPLAQAQKELAQVRGPLRFVRSLGEIAPIMQQVDGIKWERFVNHLAHESNVPVDVIMSEAELQEKRRQAAERVQRQQALEQLDTESKAFAAMNRGNGQGAGAAGGQQPVTVLPFPVAR